MKKIMFVFFVSLFFNFELIGQPMYKNMPKELVTNGFIDSFGFFRFSSTNYLLDYFSRKIEQKIEGDFYFYKEGFIKGTKNKFYLVYLFSEYKQIYPNSFSENLSRKQIRKKLEAKEELSKKDIVSKKRFIVDYVSFKKIMEVSDSSFISNYVSNQGLLSSTNGDTDLLKAILRLLKMNIPVEVIDFSGDIVIPTKKITYSKW